MKYTEQNGKIISSWKEKYGLPWMEPISHEDYIKAAAGEEILTLTPLRKVPFAWYKDCSGKKVLGLAAGGGQQMAILSALGAECTLLDISDRQIESDRLVSERENYPIISDTDRDGDWPIRYNKVIIPYSVLDSRVYNGEEHKRARSFGLSELDPEPHFDLVIVDEAHHIRNGSMEKEKAFAYKCTKYFCDHADAVVMLTATPLQTGDKDLFTLLNVLRPDVVIDQKTFEMMSKPNEYISRAVHSIRTAGEGWSAIAIEELLKVRKTQWGDNVIAENPLYDDILIRLEQQEISREERVKLISDIESLHSFSTMINRTRRRDIQDFCVRRSHTISTEFTEYQKNLHDELLSFEQAALSMLHNPRSVNFMMSTIKRQAASCIFGLAPFIRDIINRRVQQLNDDPEIDYSSFDMDGKSNDAISALAVEVLSLADYLPSDDPKFEEMLKIIQQKQSMNNNKIMLFSTFRHTLAYLKEKLSKISTSEIIKSAVRYPSTGTIVETIVRRIK